MILDWIRSFLLPNRDEVVNEQWKLYKRNSVLDFAKSQLGKPYHFGAGVSVDDPDPKEWDCSSLTRNAFMRNKLQMPAGSYNQYPFCIPVEKPSPGDLGFMRDDKGQIDHVELYLSPTQTIGAVGGYVGRVRVHPAGVKWFEESVGFAGWRRHPEL